MEADMSATARQVFMKKLLQTRSIGGRPVPIVPFHNWDYYYITEDLTWDPNLGDGQRYNSITAPKYFVTDLASVPEPFWSLLPPAGPYSYPAILHDWLYWTQPSAKIGDNDRAYADEILKLAMADLDVPSVNAVPIYEAVRLFGGSAWRNNAKARANGERRVLKRVPADSNITWAAWKADPNNFT